MNDARIRTESSKRQVWAAILVLLAFLCCLHPLILEYRYLTATTKILKRILDIDVESDPIVILAIILSYIGFMLSERRSKVYYASVGVFLGSFLLSTTLCGTNYLFGVCSCIAFMLALMRIPKNRNYHYVFAFIAFFISMIWTPEIMWWTLRSEIMETRNVAFQLIADALDAYHADYKDYPVSTSDPSMRQSWQSDSGMPTFIKYQYDRAANLLEPVNYIKANRAIVMDPFCRLKEDRAFAYYRWSDRACILISAGPNCIFEMKPEDLEKTAPGQDGKLPDQLVKLKYDPTNGELSAGDMFLMVSGVK